MSVMAVGQGHTTNSSRSARTTAAMRSAAWHSLNAGPAPPQRFNPSSVLPLVSSAVESSAQMATFESFAGRSAMIGFSVAVALEWGTEQSTFNSLDPSQAAALGALVISSLSAAALLAAAAARPPAAGGGRGAAEGARNWWWLGAAIHEAVMSSLTGTQRSASGVTQHKVDEVVDFVVDRCLTQSVHPVFGPLRDAGSTVVTVMDSFILAGEDRPDLPQ